MRYIIRYTPAAQKDMDDVWDGVLQASRSFDIADKYVDEFVNEIANKKNFPKSGTPIYYRGLFTGFYSVDFKAYKAFYRVNEEYIDVIRILLAKMDYLKILFGKSE